ncbi:MAG: hypothetical protein CMB29_05755 [Euryarchaeota archaeon]|nr:hypothetical protein [Euryarchaeota archaeon]|tara:strand:+ start:17435 stop:18475 length:1041 start_codon:yes stop_codon:yes gene_type:complete
MVKSTVLGYGGYYSSGGSVIRDIFKEFSPRFDVPNEFRLIKERGGLLDLDYAINKDMSPENIGLAVNEFLWITKQLSRKSTRFGKAGFSYGEFTNNQFLDLTSKYINSITDYYYPMNWHYHTFKKSYLRQMIEKILVKIFIRNKRILKGSYSYPLISLNEEYFIKKTIFYLEDIFSSIRKYRRISDDYPVGLHNIVYNFNPNILKRVKTFIPNLRLFIVDRDPRDIYLNLVKDSYSRYLPKNTMGIKKAECFIRFFKSIRIHKDEISKMNNVFIYQFEDFCFNYEQTLSKLLLDSKLDSINHKNKNQFFDSLKSQKNIGQWKSVKKNVLPEIKKIEKELEKYLINI